MAVDSEGNWDGVCACGKVEADGIRCIYGATHQHPAPKEQPMPWEAQTPVKEKMPWEA